MFIVCSLAHPLGPSPWPTPLVQASSSLLAQARAVAGMLAQGRTMGAPATNSSLFRTQLYSDVGTMQEKQTKGVRDMISVLFKALDRDGDDKMAVVEFDELLVRGCVVCARLVFWLGFCHV